MPIVRLSCGPSGITTMKSTMLKNWTEARTRSRMSSRRRCSAGTVMCFPFSPSRITCAPEDLSALKAFSVAIITSVSDVRSCLPTRILCGRQPPWTAVQFFAADCSVLVRRKAARAIARTAP